MHHVNVKTVFLNRELNDEIYMFLPDGMVGKEKLKNKYVCKLQRVLPKIN